MQKTLRDELRDVISGKSQVRHGEAIQAIAHYLEIGSSASANPEKDEQIRSQEKKRLEQYVSQHQLWLVDIDLSKYVSEGAEQKVYLKDSESVFKLNDAIYYRSWVDYFRNLLLHNYFFNDTAYQLIGFYKSAGVVSLCRATVCADYASYRSQPSSIVSKGKRIYCNKEQ